MTQFIGPNPTKKPSLSWDLFCVTRKRFERIHSNLLAHRPGVWQTVLDGVGREDITNQLKFLVLIWLIGTIRSLQDVVDQAETGKETFRHYFKNIFVDVKEV